MTNFGTILLVAVVYAVSLGCYLCVTKIRVSYRIYRNAFVFYGLLFLLFEFLPENRDSLVRLIPFYGFPEDWPVGYRILELFGCVLLFVPGGFLSGMRSCLKGEPNAFSRTMLLAAAVSLVCELIQLAPLGKTFAVDHLLCNLVGALIGFALFSALARTERMQGILRNILYPDGKTEGPGENQ